MINIITGDQKTVTVTPKPFYLSRTVWLNVIGIVIVVLQYLGTINLLPEELLATILGIINLLLRFVTDNPVKV